jgi:hypothetical protein
MLTKNLCVWPTQIKKTIEENIGPPAWAAALEHVVTQHDLQGSSKKNALKITAALEHLYSEGRRAVILDDLCDLILRAASGLRTEPPSEPRFE